jgi:hypothetical protein
MRPLMPEKFPFYAHGAWEKMPKNVTLSKVKIKENWDCNCKEKKKL